MAIKIVHKTAPSAGVGGFNAATGTQVPQTVYANSSIAFALQLQGTGQKVVTDDSTGVERVFMHVG